MIAGDRWAWKRDDLTEYAAGDHTLKYAMRLEGDGSTEIEIEAAANGNGYLIEVGATLTKAYSPGVYHWQAYISRNTDDERITIDGGTISVEQDRALSIAFLIFSGALFDNSFNIIKHDFIVASGVSYVPICDRVTI